MNHQFVERKERRDFGGQKKCDLKTDIIVVESG